MVSRLLHLGVTISRRSSGGGDVIAVDEGQSFGPEQDASFIKVKELLTSAPVLHFPRFQ